MNVAIRAAERADAETIHAIRTSAADALTAEFGSGHWSHVESLDTLRRHAVDRDLFLAMSNGEAFGTFELESKTPGFYSRHWFTDPDAPAYYLFSMAIVKTSQRRGLGRTIMDEMEAMAVAHGKRALRLDAYDAPAGAGVFYEKCGFVLVHEGSFNRVPLRYYEKVLAG